ncbi:MAG: ABC transporter permease [Kiritimatiellae bacterium]|nr:ABC transporter permease [Kiritimatiellia bacterium]
MLSSLSRKRLSAFRRIRRAWWALMAFAALFAFSMAAELVCPCDPQRVTPASELEPYCRETTTTSYDIKTVRYSVRDDGTVFDREGPEEIDERDYVVRRTKRPGYTRVFMEPKSPPAATTRSLGRERVTFPFRPCPGHPFGLDGSGRDVYSRIVHAMRIALLFGLALALSGLFIGLVIGAVEGYFGGRTDIVFQRFTEIWSALPFLYVMIFIGSTLGRSFAVLLVCYGIFNWIAVSYYMRAEFLRLRKRQFVDAARVQGFGTLHIVFKQVLPNALTPLITLFPFLLLGAIGSLSALDFLGFGLPPMTPSCGELLFQGQLYPDAWWLVVFPALALFIVMVLAVLIGEGLREAFDPRQRSRIE